MTKYTDLSAAFVYESAQWLEPFIDNLHVSNALRAKVIGKQLLYF